MELAGGTAVITGAAGGIGRALALALAARGMRLALLDLDGAGLGETRALLPAEAPPATLHEVDVADDAAVAEAARAVAEAHGPAITLLVNNAGIYVPGRFEALDPADFRRVVDVNLWGVVHGCRAFLPALRRAPAARIVNILSDFALVGFPGKAAYCTAKFAARGFGEVLRCELRGTTVGVTAVYPPAVDTGLVRRAKAADELRRDREAAFVAARAMPVDKVAARIVRGVVRGRARVLIGGTTRLIDLAARVAPAAAQRAVARAAAGLDFV